METYASPSPARDLVRDKSRLANNDQHHGESNAAVAPVKPLDFALAIREKRQPRTSLENALVVQTMTDTIYLSAEQNKAVKIDLKGIKS